MASSMFCLAALIAGRIAAMTPAIIAIPIHKNVCGIETAKTVLLKKYAVDRLSNRGGGEFAEFIERLIMTK